MNPNPAGRASVIAAIMVGVGALLSGFVGFLFVIWGVPNLPRTMILQDPIGFALRPRPIPLAVVAMFLALIVIVALTWFFVRLVVRSALPKRGSAVFFGTWGAVIIASWIAGMVRAPLAISALGIPSEQSEILMVQGFQVVTAGAAWGLTWGWITALVVTLIHRSASAPEHVEREASSSHPATTAYPYPPHAGEATQTSTSYPPQPPHAG
ncbi:hypothetical protein [Microbacterium phyllosphaerae]|uniref:hypothetical protein n=1 Tax=Microbacterium phyllosphaerae TaxID=124798 RepID=UPI002167EA1B|nr:hypothetical protein [Microbacterium phyllosphaerae]MCS3441463.1 hypothetical protein [Microbacterium phyllosphaerae]